MKYFVVNEYLINFQPGKLFERLDGLLLEQHFLKKITMEALKTSSRKLYIITLTRLKIMVGLTKQSYPIKTRIARMIRFPHF